LKSNYVLHEEAGTLKEVISGENDPQYKIASYDTTTSEGQAGSPIQL